jgi:hypothetical protein
MLESHRPFVTAALLTLPLLAFGLPASAAPTPWGDEVIARGSRPLHEVEKRTLPRVDHGALLAEDAAHAGPGVPMRFAQPQAVSYAPGSSGSWEVLDDGSHLWRLWIHSPGALSLNFGFTRYRMPEGGSLVIYTPDGRELMGPFTAADNEIHGELWTPILPGDQAVLEARLPAGAGPGLELELTAVNHGYRALGTIDKSGSCNVDVACPEGNGWRDQIRSVGRIVISGSFLCTGFMVNNTAEDLTPYFMTADHCNLSTGNAASLVVYWNYVHPGCRPPGSPASGGNGGGNLNQSQSGASYLAGSAASDFTLVELDDMPPAASNVYWAGWDARQVNPSAAVAIHHPQGEEKRISFENDPTTTTTYLGGASPGDGSHIRVDDWDVGTTEGGSSGSPLFNPAGRVVGQLHGGFAACGNDLPDWYGRISTSWGLGLSTFLDPVGGGAIRTLAGRDASDPGGGGGGDGGGGGGDDGGGDGGGTVDPFICETDDFTMCLSGGRFQVRVGWRNFDDETGPGTVVEFGSDDSGLFWFFNDQNWEMLVKVIDGCGFNGHYWVFAAATTNVQYTLEVTDSQSGEVQLYENPLGTSAPALTDTEAFATCP